MLTKLITIIGLIGTAHAHKPAFGLHPTLNSAYHVDDTDISMVLYQDITCEADQVWLHFDAVEGEEVFFQLGVPVLERLEDYRPTLALVAEGLPASDEVPFEMPEGHSALTFHASETPVPFYEPFTQTSSWIWVEETYTMPATGNAWLVAYHPEEMTGKMWVAMGTIEDFSDVQPDDWTSWVSKLADFHETNGERDVEESYCGDDLQSEETNAEAAACNSSASHLGWAALALMLPIAVRRRDTVLTERLSS